MDKQSLSGFGFKGTGMVAVLFVIGIILEYASKKNYLVDDLSVLGIVAILTSIITASILGIIEITERYKKLKNPFD